MTKIRNEKIAFHELEEVTEATAVEATDIANRFPRHVHSGFIFSLIDRGSRRVKIHSEEITFSAGEMCILPPGTPHSCESISGNSLGPHSYRALCISARYMQKLTEEITGQPCHVPDFNPAMQYRGYETQSFNEIFRLLHVPDTGLEKQTALNSFLYHAIINFSSGKIVPEKTGPQNEALQRVKIFIEDKFREKLSLKDLAGTACISPYHLQKLFLNKYGLSQQEYIISCRVHEAKRIINAGSSLSDAAVNSGFSDQSHFSRHFKRVIGISPGRFLKENCKAPSED